MMQSVECLPPEAVAPVWKERGQVKCVCGGGVSVCVYV